MFWDKVIQVACSFQWRFKPGRMTGARQQLPLVSAKVSSLSELFSGAERCWIASVAGCWWKITWMQSRMCSWCRDNLEWNPCLREFQYRAKTFWKKSLSTPFKDLVCRISFFSSWWHTYTHSNPDTHTLEHAHVFMWQNFLKTILDCSTSKYKDLNEGNFISWNGLTPCPKHYFYYFFNSLG